MALAQMSTWRRKAQEQFPEHARELETSSREGWSMILSNRLKYAVASGDADVLRQGIGYVAWCWNQKSTDEQFVYFVEDIVNRLLKRPGDRASFCGVVDASSFASVLPIYANFHGETLAQEFEREFRFSRSVNNSFEGDAAKPRT